MKIVLNTENIFKPFTFVYKFICEWFKNRSHSINTARIGHVERRSKFIFDLWLDHVNKTDYQKLITNIVNFSVIKKKMRINNYDVICTSNNNKILVGTIFKIPFSNSTICEIFLNKIIIILLERIGVTVHSNCLSIKDGVNDLVIGKLESIKYSSNDSALYFSLAGNNKIMISVKRYQDIVPILLNFFKENFKN